MHSVHQDAPFEPSKSTIGIYFFTTRGDPFNLGGSKKVSFNLPHPTDKTRQNLKYLGQMLLKNSLRDTLAPNLSICPLPTVK